MTTSRRRTELVIPAVQYGNITLMPQPARGWGENTEKMYHAKDLAPHAPVRRGLCLAARRIQGRRRRPRRHARHARMARRQGHRPVAGRRAGRADVDMPDLYIYNVDVVGEGLVARRRGMATLIDHMVPPFKKGGLYPELAELERDDQRLRQATEQQPRAGERLSASGSGQQLIDARHRQGSRSRTVDKPGSLNEAVIHQRREPPDRAEGPEHPLRSAHLRQDAGEAAARHARSTRSSAPTDPAAEQGQGAGRRDGTAHRRVRSPASWTVWCARCAAASSARAAAASRFAIPTPIRRARTSTASIPTRCPKPASWEMGVKLARADAGGSPEAARQVSREGVVRHLGRRDDAPRGRDRVADLLPAGHEAGLGRPRQGRRRPGHPDARSSNVHASTSSSRRRQRACSTTSRC